MLTIIYVVLMIPAMVVGWLALGFGLHEYFTKRKRK
jgi:hypothetical protein